MIKEYAGIGSRETPEKYCSFITCIAKFLDKNGYALRSGGAKGADIAFELGSWNSKIFLPWKGFNNSNSPLYLESFTNEILEEAQKLAIKYYHSNSMPETTLKYMTRNVMQILDSTLNNPVDFVLCWTKDGKASGGTGQALRIAKDYEIPIYNFFNKNDIEKFTKEVIFNLV